MVGSVIVTFKIMPEGVETDLDALEKAVIEKIKPQRLQRIPIAFGINAIQIIKYIEEKDGELDRVTDKIKSIKGVQEVEVIDLTRSL
jgi:translation elongation factor aEF-1 beta